MKNKDVKPFNWDKPLVTGDGRQARLLCRDFKSQNNRTPYVVAVLGNVKGQAAVGQDGLEQLYCYEATGQWPGGGPGYPYNLKNITIKTYKWMVLKDPESSDTKITRKNYSEEAAREKFGGRLLMHLPATVMEEE